MCHSRNAKHILSSTYERWWRQNRCRLRVPDFATIHTMRHTFSTLLIVYCGADTSTVQALTGHEKPDVLLEIYTHTHQGAKLAAMTKLQDFLFPYDGTQNCRHCKHWCPAPDGMQEKGVCWESGSAVLVICSTDQECNIEKFDLKPAA
ncbi:tyrosine-type recombinase/integrase [Gordonibacter sp.]|uniref:tyrosine-type recombinase/integrase n=1 Tax=Gordonibacter sp. TaxID=1968902 RepID=UPI003AA1A72F